MKLLPLVFRKYGVEYRQEDRGGGVAIYSLRHREDLSAIVGFDVVVIVTEPDREIHGKMVYRHERYPGNSEWGRLGWSYTTREVAQRRYDVERISKGKLASEKSIPKGDRGEENGVPTQSTLGDR